MSKEVERQASPAHDCWKPNTEKLPGATSNSSENHPAGGVAAGRGELIAKLGTVVSAVMASSCCWLPVLLLAVGVSGAGIASTLEAYRPFFMTVTFGFLAMAFYFTYRPQIAGWGQAAPAAGNRRRFTMMTLNKGMLWAVTLMAVVFLFFPQYMTGLVGGAGETLTADMTHSVLQVEGMTCKGWETVAAQAIQQAPGVLAVNVDYEKQLATIGTQPGQPVPKEAILAALKAIQYQGQFVE